MNDLSSSLRLGDEGINMVLHSLQSIRERALSKFPILVFIVVQSLMRSAAKACRACIFALHMEMSRLIEVQHAFRQLSYLEIRRRVQLTVELTRIAISVPLALEQAIMRDKGNSSHTESDEMTVMLNGRVRAILRRSAVVLARIERFLD
jgi:hypothetical protein